MNEYEWISCTESLPNVGEEVFIYLWKTSPYIAWIDENEKWHTEEFEVDENEEPTEWMPLPKPPSRLVDLNEVIAILAAWLSDEDELDWIIAQMQNTLTIIKSEN